MVLERQFRTWRDAIKVAPGQVARTPVTVSGLYRGWLPASRIRFRLCWGSWHGPHTTDLPIANIVGVLLAINAGAYSFEAANARHEHEWKVWRDVRAPNWPRASSEARAATVGSG